MSNLSRDDEIRLREFTEAAEICRWYERLTRVTLGIYLPFAVALIGYVRSNYMAAWDRLVLYGAGAIVTLLAWNLVIRQQQYYRAYISRLRILENELGMHLYETGDQKMKESHVAKFTLANKTAIWLVMLIAFLYFAVAVVYVGREALQACFLTAS